MDATESQPIPASPPKPSRGWGQRFRRAAVLYVLVPYLAITLIFTIFQRKLLYRPTVAESLNVADVGLNPNAVRDVQLQTSDGEKLNGWLFQQSHQNPEHKPPLVLYFPGNSLNRQERIHDLREVAACGYDVLVFDYRGFGDSSGTPSEKNLTADARQIWEYALKDLKYDESRIVIFGESLGGAVALSLWSEENSHPPQPSALILNSTFLSMPRTVAWHYPMFPFHWLLLDRWSSNECITRVRVPIIVFHGTADEMVPVAHGRELAQSSTSARFVEIPGAVHNEIPMHQLREELTRIREAMTEKNR